MAKGRERVRSYSESENQPKNVQFETSCCDSWCQLNERSSITALVNSQYLFPNYVLHVSACKSHHQAPTLKMSNSKMLTNNRLLCRMRYQSCKVLNVAFVYFAVKPNLSVICVYIYDYSVYHIF